jgi:DNA-binding transcriptional regulator PaaX
MTDRPGQVPREHVLNNQRPSLSERSKKRVSSQERREGNCEKHLALLRLCPCAVSLKMPAGEVHHLKMGLAGQERGMGMRATDKWGIPLCHDVHMDLESHGSRREYEFLSARGLHDPIGLADALWRCVPKTVEAYTKIILAHREQKVRI